MEICNFDIDDLSFFDLKVYVKELGFDDVLDLYYTIPGLDLKSGLRKWKNDIESIDMATCARANKALTVYIIHKQWTYIDSSYSPYPIYACA